MKSMLFLIMLCYGAHGFACLGCLAEDDNLIKGLTQLIAKPPGKIIDQIVVQGASVIVAETNRVQGKSIYFRWGDVRKDQVAMNDISSLAGVMGKTFCPQESPVAKKATIVVAADAPFSALIHEYIHYLQMEKDKSWCSFALKILGKSKLSEQEQQRINDKEWDVRKILWQLRANNRFNLEDRILIAEGTLREGLARKSDHNAKKFLKDNKVEEYLMQLVEEYKKTSSK